MDYILLSNHMRISPMIALNLRERFKIAKPDIFLVIPIHWSLHVYAQLADDELSNVGEVGKIFVHEASENSLSIRLGVITLFHFILKASIFFG